MVTDALCRQHGIITSLMIQEWQSLELIWMHDVQPIESAERAYIGSLTVQPTLLGKVRQMQNLDGFLVNKLDDHVVDLIDDCPTDWSVDSDEGLQFKGRLYLPNIVELRKEIVNDAHRSRYTIHPGGTKMHHDLKRMFWWEGMKKDVGQYVSRCYVCQ